MTWAPHPHDFRGSEAGVADLCIPSAKLPSVPSRSLQGPGSGSACSLSSRSPPGNRSPCRGDSSVLASNAQGAEKQSTQLQISTKQFNIVITNLGSGVQPSEVWILCDLAQVTWPFWSFFYKWEVERTSHIGPLQGTNEIMHESLQASFHAWKSSGKYFHCLAPSRYPVQRSFWDCANIINAPTFQTGVL